MARWLMFPKKKKTRQKKSFAVAQLPSTVNVTVTFEHLDIIRKHNPSFNQDSGGDETKEHTDKAIADVAAALKSVDGGLDKLTGDQYTSVVDPLIEAIWSQHKGEFADENEQHWSMCKLYVRVKQNASSLTCNLPLVDAEDLPDVNDFNLQHLGAKFKDEKANALFRDVLEALYELVELDSISEVHTARRDELFENVESFVKTGIRECFETCEPVTSEVQDWPYGPRFSFKKIIAVYQKLKEVGPSAHVANVDWESMGIEKPDGEAIWTSLRERSKLASSHDLWWKCLFVLILELEPHLLRMNLHMLDKTAIGTFQDFLDEAMEPADQNKSGFYRSMIQQVFAVHKACLLSTPPRNNTQVLDALEHSFALGKNTVYKVRAEIPDSSGDKENTPSPGLATTKALSPTREPASVPVPPAVPRLASISALAPEALKASYSLPIPTVITVDSMPAEDSSHELVPSKITARRPSTASSDAKSAAHPPTVGETATTPQENNPSSHNSPPEKPIARKVSRRSVVVNKEKEDKLRNLMERAEYNAVVSISGHKVPLPMPEPAIGLTPTGPATPAPSAVTADTSEAPENGPLPESSLVFDKEDKLLELLQQAAVIAESIAAEKKELAKSELRMARRLKAAQESLIEIQFINAKLLAENANLREEKYQREAELATMKEQTKASAIEIEQLNETVEELSLEKQMMASSLEQSKQECTKLWEELEHSRDENSSLEAELEAEKAAKAEIGDELQASREEMASVEDKLNETIKMLDMANDEIERLEELEADKQRYEAEARKAELEARRREYERAQQEAEETIRRAEEHRQARAAARRRSVGIVDE